MGATGQRRRTLSDELAALRTGAWIAPGTPIGIVAEAAAGQEAHFLFEIHPAGAGPIDPRPVLQAWQTLDETQGSPQAGTTPLFGPDAAEAPIEEIQLMSEPQLEADLLSDPRARIYACGRQDIAAGRIDRRVLASLYLLLVSGIDPTVSALECGHGGEAQVASTREHANGEAVTISALNGTRVAAGSLAELAVHRLLTMPGTMAPRQVIGPVRIPSSSGTAVRHGAPDRLDIGFGPPTPTHPAPAASLPPQTPAQSHSPTGGPPAAPAGSSPPTGATNAPQPESQLNTAEWRRLIARLSHLTEPHVPKTPTSSAVPDTASSPPPAAEPLSASLPLPGAGERVTAPGSRRPTSGPRPQVAATSGEPNLDAPLSSPLVSPLTSGPAVVLETPGVGNVVTEHGPILTLEAKPIGVSIKSYEFQYEPIEGEEAESWRPIEMTSTPSIQINTQTIPLIDGLYDLRVIATAAQGEEYESELRDRLVANESPIATLADPGTNLRGTIQLNASWPAAGSITSVSFQWAQSESAPGPERWRTIEPSKIPVSKAAGASVSLDTTSLPGDGEYDFRIVPSKNKELVTSIPVRGRLIDNTPPTVSTIDPGPRVHGQVSISAQANDSGSGVASVRFQARPQGGVWRNLGGRTTLPTPPGSDTYSHTINSEALQNGSYDFRAIAEDRAGNETVSAPVASEVDNPSATALSASISGVVAPAQKVHFLGTIANSSEHEAWGYGFTSAPPAEVGGSRLPYTAQGEQLVLLRYTDSGGWQISDVPRLSNGEPFHLLPADEVSSRRGEKNTTNQVHVSGAMTPSGEAWMSVSEVSTNPNAEPVIGIFHRVPGGQFVLDSSATQTLGPLLGSESANPGLLDVSLRLGESEGHAYGILTAPGQSEQSGMAPIQGGSVPVQEKLEYGLLDGGSWGLESAEPPSGVLHAGELVTLQAADIGSSDEGWGAFKIGAPQPGLGLILGHFHGKEWTFARTESGTLGTGLDALDLTGSVANPQGTVQPKALKAEGNDVWVEAEVNLPPHSATRVVARYEGSSVGSGKVLESWCSLAVANSCEEALGSAAVPDAIFQTGSGPLALALTKGAVDVFAHGNWKSVSAPGYEPSGEGSEDVFNSATEGWLAGEHALGHWSTEHSEGASSALADWPLPDRSPLTSVALPSGSAGAISESGALAVGFGGTTLSYDPSAGWLVQPAPPRARHINLLSVAFAGPSSAFAVGQLGVILHWNGSAWTEDPQSIKITSSQLNAVAFSPSGEGWAVGANGTILHYDGTGWSTEQPPAADSGVDITSVAVAGSEAFAVANGNLIAHSSAGWQEVGSSLLPSPAPTPGNLRLVAGLPDGGVVAAGRSLVLVREASGQGFAYAAQPLQGIAVALAPYRGSDGKLRTYASVAPPAAESLSHEIGGFPAGDGELLRQTDSGWQDLSHAQYAGGRATGDGAMKSDPVLAVAASPDGEHAWAVGGYDGTEDAAGQGTIGTASASRPAGWQSASVWRYDTTGSAAPSELAPTQPNLPAQPGTVSFAFFTSPMCRTQCAGVPGAQPDVNLTSAAKEIAAYAAQPGGPAFAMLGGNAVGPVEGQAWENGNGEADFAQLPELLAPLGSVPTFAALGKFDHVPTDPSNETRPWAEAFSSAPPPFGSGPEAPGITPVASGAPSGEVHRYYAFDAAQNGGTLRVIVLDNSEGSLEDSERGQRTWLQQQLQAAQLAHLPVVVVTAIPLRSQTDPEGIASLLASSGVVAVFTTDGTLPTGRASELHELDEHHLIPETSAPGESQIPEYEGASLGYQQSQNNGVMWYFVSINTATSTPEAQVSAIPVVESLSLKALDGLNVARSLTLQFEAIGRRPAGTLATNASEEPAFPGFDDYVEIPSPGCSGGRPCVQPSYKFTSSEPAVGDFVVPSGAGSSFPALESKGHPIHSSTSGLFCAYNSGSTTVTISAGLLSYSLPVTVQPGGFGAPCGTVFKAGVSPVVVVHSAQNKRAPKGAAAPPPPPAAALSGVNPTLAAIPPPPPAPVPPLAVPPAAVKPPPAQPVAPAEPPPAFVESVSAPPVILPLAAPAIEPIPPGGTAQAPSAAERREKARKQASQSAYTIRPSGVSGEVWFYGAVGIATVFVLMLTARGLPSGPKPRPVLLDERTVTDRRRRQRRR